MPCGRGRLGLGRRLRSPTSRFWLIRGLWGSSRATQDIDSPLERVHARAHLTSLNVSSDEVADGGSYRDACWTSGKADQRAGECKYSRNHRVSFRGFERLRVPVAGLERPFPALVSMPLRESKALSTTTRRTAIADRA